MVTFEKIYNENYKNVLAYVNFRLKNNVVAEEITNDVFLKANRLLSTYEESKAKASTWLMTIANCAIIDNFRCNKSGKYEVNVSDFSDAETGKEVFQFVGSRTNEANFEVENNELASALDIAFETLAPKLKEVANLFFKSEKKYEEIAEILDIPLGSVKAYINRARTALQSQLVNEKRQYA